MVTTAEPLMEFFLCAGDRAEYHTWVISYMVYNSMKECYYHPMLREAKRLTQVT